MLYVSGYDEKRGLYSVTDTTDWPVEWLTMEDLSQKGEVIGVADGNVVFHDQVKAQLWEYVNLAETSFGIGAGKYRGMDEWVVGGIDFCGNTENTVLNIVTPGTVVEVLDGYLVRERKLVDEDDLDLFEDGAVPLYDILSKYCKQMDSFILRYETIQFSNDTYRTTIRLKHDARADRYLVDMYLAATGCH